MSAKGLSGKEFMDLLEHLAQEEKAKAEEVNAEEVKVTIQDLRRLVLQALEGAGLSGLGAVMIDMTITRGEAAEWEETVASASAELLDLQEAIAFREADVLQALMESGDYGRNADERKINTEAALRNDAELGKLHAGQLQARQAEVVGQALSDSLHRKETLLWRLTQTSLQDRELKLRERELRLAALERGVDPCSCCSSEEEEEQAEDPPQETPTASL